MSANRRNPHDGGIDQRGTDHWRLRWRVGGKRYSKAFHGSKRAAQAELRRLIEGSTTVAPNRIKLIDWVQQWIEEAGLSPKTAERYRQMVRRQIRPYLGAIHLQEFGPRDVARWHTELQRQGLAAQTIRSAQSLLLSAIGRAMALEMVGRNVARLVKLPPQPRQEVKILSQEQIAAVLDRLRQRSPTHLYPVVMLALATGMRRGELLALTWKAIDWERGQIQVRASLEQTDAGLRVKEPKTAVGRRTISIPASTLDMLRAHRLQQQAYRLRYQFPKLAECDHIFLRPDLELIRPDSLSSEWLVAVRRIGITVKFHALRHTHASALIAAKLDVVAVARRLGHASPAVTLAVYSHFFDAPRDDAAAAAVEALFR